MNPLRLLETGPIAALLDFLFPPLCLGCGEYCEDPESICRRCQTRFDTFTGPVCANCGAVLGEGYPECPICRGDYKPLLAFADYREPLKEIIIQFKFKGITRAARFVAQRLVEQQRDEIARLRPEALVPIPLHPSREHTRGYNQATLFAIELARTLDLPVHEDVIERIGRRRPQSRIEHDDRERNVRGVFAARENDYEPLRILLVDDVVTTGATAREAWCTLSDAGHRVVGIVSMAHGV